MAIKQGLLSEIADEELVRRVRKGDREALGELFRRYHQPFFNLAYRFLGDYYLADDLTSEIFWRIYKYLKTFDLRAKFKPWAYKVATNACLTFRRQNSKDKTQNYNSKFKIFSEEEADNEVEIRDEKVDLVKEAEKNEVAERVQKALGKVPKKYRLVLYLYYFEDLKYEEIAEYLQLPLNTVRTHLKRGKEMLKKDLADLIKKFS